MSASSLAYGVVQVVGRYKIHLCTSTTGPSTEPLSVIKATKFYGSESGRTLYKNRFNDTADKDCYCIHWVMIIRAHYDVMVIAAEEEEHVTGQNFEADNLPHVLKIEHELNRGFLL